jgi:cytoskeletal protein RodZ
MTRRRRQFQNAAENLRQADLDNIAHFEPRRETVGDLLRRAREGKRLEIAAVANQSRIRSGYLKAIEEGRFQDLPGLTYAVGFVRTYADHLGLDAEDVVRRFRDEVAELKSQTQLIFPVVAAEGKIPRGAVLLLSAVLAAIAYGGWYYLSEREESALDLIPALPTKLQELISGDSATPSDPTSEVLPGMTNGGTTNDGTTGESTSAVPAPAATADPAPAAPAPAAETPADPSSPVTPAAPLATDGAATDGATTGSVAPTIPGIASAPDTPPAASAPVPAPQAPTDATTESTAAVSALPGAPQSAATAPAAPVPTAPAPADPAPPSVAAPNLDASGLPTVAAPAAPPSANIPGISAPSDATTLPPVAEGEVFGATEGGSRIVLVARLESWIQVTDPETNALLTRVLRAGDRYYVPAEADLTLATGNAGGLDVWVDGRKAPALGPVGVVRRGIALDAARLESGTALPE